MLAEINYSASSFPGLEGEDVPTQDPGVAFINVGLSTKTHLSTFLTNLKYWYKINVKRSFSKMDTIFAYMFGGMRNNDFDG